MKLSLRAVLLTLLLAPAPAFAQLAPPPPERGATALGLALRRLSTVGSVLYVTAHPDDENNAVLVALSRGRGLRTGLLTLTRGEGGQNAIGAEQGEALGVLRTGELLAAHRWDGVEQFFGRAYEFGFSFSIDETFARWGHEETLGDVVRVVRRFRPDVILTLPLEDPGHQHHTAAARLAVGAFRAAADPARFPEQIQAGLRPWQARRVYQGGIGVEATSVATVAGVVTTTFDPLLGATWTELGAAERTEHKCQAARQLGALPGEGRTARFALVDSVGALPASGPEPDILDGIDTSIGGMVSLLPADAAALRGVDAAARSAQEAFDPGALLGATKPLVAGLAQLRALEARVQAADVLERLQRKDADFVAALNLAEGLAFEAFADDGDVTPGQTFSVTARAINEGRDALALGGLELEVPKGWSVAPAPDAARRLGPGEILERQFKVSVAPDARPTHPYWTRRAGSDRYDLETPACETLPFCPPEVVAVLRHDVGGVEIVSRAAVVWRYEGRWVGGEKRKAVSVVPPLSVRLVPELAVFPLGAGVRREFRVTVTSGLKAPAEATVRLEAPAEFEVEPPEAALRFQMEGEEAAARFTVTAPPRKAAGEWRLAAVVRSGGIEQRTGSVAIAYDHVEERRLVREASARVLGLDVRVAPKVSVGYVMGAGDLVADAIRQLGLPVTLLSADDLAFGDLSAFTTIVTGVRAYGARADLRAQNARLLRYAEGGGHLVVQYDRDEFNAGAGASPFAPFPARVTASRVTDETAKIEVLQPASPLLNVPNRIAGADWDGWVQERGLQLLEARDPRYVDLLAAADPFPKNPGLKKGLLVHSALGRGSWTYVGLALFRQLPAGNPGAYRLLANLLSQPQVR